MSDTRQRTTLGTRFRFLLRVVGLTGVVATAVGAVMLDTVFRISDWTIENVRAAGEGANGSFAQNAAWILAVGLVAIGIALLFEFLGGLVLVTGRRTLANTTATISTAAAVAILIIVNIYSFTHHKRYDLTRDKLYTLPPNLVERF